MLGMGIATSACHFCAILVFIVEMIRSPGVLNLSFKNIRIFDALSVIKAGAPVAAEKLFRNVSRITFQTSESKNF
jgi:Na+-driven multidrug efflux pump